MIPQPYSTGLSQLSTGESVVFDFLAGVPHLVTPAPPSIQFHLPHTLMPDALMETFSNQIYHDPTQGMVQDPYLPFQYAPYLSHVPPRTAIVSIDNSICAAQWNENGGTSFPDVDLTWPSSFPSPSPPPVLTPCWFKVPQRVYEHGRRQWDFKQGKSILFNIHGFPGINMEDALHKRFTGLDNRDEPMFRNSAGAISCRFLFPGYEGSSAQISTLGWTKHRARITRSKLAHDVAKKLNQYLKSMAGCAMDKSVDKEWEIGQGYMQFENMYLVRLVSVSAGSFQPEVWIRVP